MSSMDMTERKRGCCLTAFLILALVANPLLGLYYLVQGPSLSQGLSEIPGWVFPLLGVLSLANFVCMIGIWRWKKWGVYGVFGLAAITFVINRLTVGAGAFSGVIGVLLLAFLLRPVWNEME